MIGEGPYRSATGSPIEEEDLWLRLDEALQKAFSDPVWAWGVAWGVMADSALFPDVRRAAEAVLGILFPMPDLP
ncbi:MAG TPA: hypothetical protein VFT74_18830 [Isosphaeraceae bacterium]|nr:hypothetical protein [Isosphaeraceae bacterium]